MRQRDDCNPEQDGKNARKRQEPFTVDLFAHLDRGKNALHSAQNGPRRQVP